MTEEEAKEWLTVNLNVSRETLDRIEAFRAIVVVENERQNLISAATIPRFWARHVVDSAQLLLHAPATGNWLDLGSGAGFPGVIVAILRDLPVTLTESRRLRSGFLREVVNRLGLSNATIHAASVESLRAQQFSVITARAFAPLPKLLTLAHRFSTEKTLWLLPKGRSAREKVASVTNAWHGVFHVKQSVTDPDAAIIVASGVKRAGQR